MAWLSDSIKPSKACLWSLFKRKKKHGRAIYLDTCIYAYSTSWHESSLFTPFELMFGCKAVIPADLDNGSEHAQLDDEEVFGQGCDPETIQKMQEDMKKRLEKAKVNIICAQQEQKEVTCSVRPQAPSAWCVCCWCIGIERFMRKKRKGGKLNSKINGLALTRLQKHLERDYIA